MRASARRAIPGPTTRTEAALIAATPIPTGQLAPPEQEREVILRLQRGDRSAVAVLYGWYSDALFRSILSRLPTVEAAEDVLKETFRTALERISDFEWTGRSIWFWLHRIAVNKAMDQHRRDKVRREAAEEPQDMPQPARLPAPDAEVHASELSRDIRTSLSRLNPRYASALEMRMLEERSREECASAFGMTIAAFDVLLHRACKAFRKVYPP